MKSLAIDRGGFVGGRWKIINKLGEGGCGKVYEVTNLENTHHYAMKIESTKSKRYNQLLKTEALVLRKVQFSMHVPIFICCDRTATFRFLVMELLGNSLSDFRKYMNRRRFSVSTTLRIGIQALQAIWDVHKTYYVHRDIKPSNFAIGIYPKHRRVYLFDFGLARSLIDPTSASKRLRINRRNIAFRGTVNYCSPNVHQGLEHGRHDDLWSLLYMCIEMIRGYLPWCHIRRKKAAILKKEISDKFLLMGCPKKFEVLLNYCRNLRYNHCPDYVGIYELFKSCIVARHIKDSDPLDWEISTVVTEQETTAPLRSTYLIPIGDKYSQTLKATNLPQPLDMLAYQYFSTNSSLSTPTSSSSSYLISSPTYCVSLAQSPYPRDLLSMRKSGSFTSSSFGNIEDDSNQITTCLSQIPQTLSSQLLSTSTMSSQRLPLQLSRSCLLTNVTANLAEIDGTQQPTILSVSLRKDHDAFDSKDELSTCRDSNVTSMNKVCN